MDTNFAPIRIAPPAHPPVRRLTPLMLPSAPAEIKEALVALFVAAVRVGPSGLDAMLPRTITYNAADEGEERDRWAYKREDRPVRWFLREFSESRGSSAVLDVLLVARPELLESTRDLAVRRVAREYAEAEAAGLAALGWTA